jgi:predicted nucleic acid-binding Zn ribbon protein
VERATRKIAVGEQKMSQKKQGKQKRRLSTTQIIFYVLSIIIVLSMVLAFVVSVTSPAG